MQRRARHSYAISTVALARVFRNNLAGDKGGETERMSADFISGLLLFGVLLFGAGYIIKEFLWESLSGAIAKRRAAMPPAPPPRQPNDHLVGAIGRIVDDGTGSGMMRVRVGMETWRARSVEGESLPVGTQVEIKAADGRVLDVVARPAAAAEQADT